MSEVEAARPAEGQITILKRSPAGQITWSYSGRVLRRDDQLLVVEAFFGRPDLPFMEVVLKQGDRFIESFYTDRWYNIFEIFDRDDGRRKGWYCNICEPAVVEGATISYVDLALDLWVSADGRQTLLDESEFEALDLNEEARRRARLAVEELGTWFRSQDPS